MGICLDKMPKIRNLNFREIAPNAFNWKAVFPSSSENLMKREIKSNSQRHANYGL